MLLKRPCVQIIISMGNVEVHDLAPVRADERKELNLSRRVNYKQYLKHMNGTTHDKCLTEIPWGIRDAISLYERMDASFNAIQDLPVEIPLRLPHLNFLDLSHNRLTSLPESFGLLFHLKTLLLKHNHLSKLPNSFTHLVKLEKVDLSNNGLRELPEAMGEMESLSKLNVAYNKLKTLPPSLGQSEVLLVLLANNNRLESPSQSLCDEGSDVTIDFLKKQWKVSTNYKPALPKTVNEFPRQRGNQLNSSVSNPHSAHAQYIQSQTHTTNTPSRIKTPLLPPLDASQLQSDDLRDKIVGLLYGAAIGDALGIATRWMSPDECNFHYVAECLSYSDIVQDEHRVRWKKGDWTDNVDQLILVLDCILAWAGVVDELDFAQRLSSWVKHGFPELGDSEGHMHSPTIEKVLAEVDFLKDPHTAAARVISQYSTASPCNAPTGIDHVNNNGEVQVNGNNSVQHNPTKSLLKAETVIDDIGTDNGSLARCLILGIPYFHEVSEVESNAVRICRATHNDPRCIASCVLISVVISLMLQGRHDLHCPDSVEDLLQTAIGKAKKHLTGVSEKQKKEFITAVNLCHLENLKPREKGRATHVLKALSAGLIVLRETSMDFKTAVTKLIMSAGDSCSNACIAGALLGCKIGYAHLPRAWVEGLRKRQVDWLNIKINLMLDMMGIP